MHAHRVEIRGPVIRISTTLVGQIVLFIVIPMRTINPT
jgi:hypothetical protein